MAREKKPSFQVGDEVVLASHVSTSYYPGVLRDTVLRVSAVCGTGTKRNPWTLRVTDGTNFWGNEPNDFVKVVR
jgi:hypothetical protein